MPNTVLDAVRLQLRLQTLFTSHVRLPRQSGRTRQEALRPLLTQHRHRDGTPSMFMQRSTAPLPRNVRMEWRQTPPLAVEPNQCLIAMTAP
jgi:hypothetical protein